MRKFIISDIHGLGNIYNSVMGYLDNINKEEPIELYINGDLIDRGPDSADILLDVIKKIENGSFNIIYLGGNHELMMHQTFKKRRKGKNISIFNNWYNNGGWITDYSLELIEEADAFKVADFVSDLKIYHKFSEQINGKNIVLVHAGCPLYVKDDCDLRIKEDNMEVFFYVWAREDDPELPFRCRIGNKNYFTIVGHTPNNNIYGYVFHKQHNYFNIDGGCAAYAKGFFEYNHVPLVEVMDGYLKILTFNNNNEIIYGNYFDGIETIPMSLSELDREREYLNHKFKPKKLIKFPDGVIGYEDW